MKVKIFEGPVQGYRTDRAEYLAKDDGFILQRAGELRAKGINSKEIVEKVAEDVVISLGGCVSS